MSKNRNVTSIKCRVSRGLLACRYLCLCLFLFSPFSLFAHEVRPAYLELHQTGAETYDVLWKVPGQGEDLRLGLYVQLPESCSNLTQPRGAFAANAYTERWSVQCAGGLSGGTIRIAGLSATLTDVLVRIERVEGSPPKSPVSRRRLPHSSSKPLPAGWKSSARISFSASSIF